MKTAEDLRKAVWHPERYISQTADTIYIEAGFKLLYDCGEESCAIDLSENKQK